MKALFYVFTMSLLFLYGCATFPTGDIAIGAAADKKVNFSGYKSYDWFAGAGIVNDPEGKWEPPGFDADAQIRFLINRELRKRGVTETADKPDFLVAYVLGIDMPEEELDNETRKKRLDYIITKMLKQLPR
jgi:hypothetical protein